MSHNILMFGWEFPPHNSGGLGVACKGLAEALARAGNQVTFVLPEQLPISSDVPGLSFVFAGADGYPQPENSPASYQSKDLDTDAGRTGGLVESVRLYGRRARRIAEEVDFDIIHAHDWLSYPAGIAAKQATGKPFIAHIHATEYDRTGGHSINRPVYEIEQAGFAAADHIISVSEFTKSILAEEYEVPEDKITPAHNGIDTDPPEDLEPILSDWKQQGNKIVLFLGRQTIQKGPDYFLQAADRLTDIRQDVLFVMAGSGDMQEELIAMAARMGIGDKVLFPGFVRGRKVDRLYQSADLYVLSSISEPFGITPLEALMNRTPVLISKQSGVSEVVNHALKVDFWDVEAMAHKMDAALRYPTMSKLIRDNGHREVKSISWADTAEVCQDCYRQVTNTA